MKRFKSILLFADGGTGPDPAIERAVALTRINDARVTIIDVVDDHESTAQMQSDFGSDLTEILRAHRRQALERVVEPYNEPDDIISTRVLIDTPLISAIRPRSCCRRQRRRCWQ
jgi:nucleotide-binding universal stress UspA family protein